MAYPRDGRGYVPGEVHKVPACTGEVALEDIPYGVPWLAQETAYARHQARIGRKVRWLLILARIACNRRRRRRREGAADAPERWQRQAIQHAGHVLLAGRLVDEAGDVLIPLIVEVLHDLGQHAQRGSHCRSSQE